MGITDLFQTGPYMNWPKKIKGVPWDVFKSATYQIVPSEHGIPMVQLDLDFLRPISAPYSFGLQRTFPSCVSNPDMTMAVLLDNSGSMWGTFQEGHAYNCCASILRHVSAAGAGYDLCFYSHKVSDAGFIARDNDLRSAISRNQPNGGTIVTEALKGTLSRYKKNHGMYIIVITDGVFQDKLEVQQFITQSILPALTIQRPYEYRLHFVGAGEGADEAFLRQIEQISSGQGFQLITSHHHAHLSHAHEDMLDEIDRAFLGPGLNFQIGEAGHLDGTGSGEHTIIRVGNVPTRQWHQGPVGNFSFIPRHMIVGFEFKPIHPATLPIEMRFRDSVDGRLRTFKFNIPLPQVEAVDNFARKIIAPLLAPRIGSDDPHTRQEAQRHMEELHHEELLRQAEDLESLSGGGIPVSARKRLEELRSGSGMEGFFTSNLAPDELALLRRHGYRPLGLVSGSAMYHVGAAFASLTDCQVRQLTDAYDRATELAVSRMEQELKALGAHGVVGVRINLIRQEWHDKTIEMQAIGTAIAGPGPAPATPWLCDLAGQEWWALHRAGYDPVALVWGHCSWFVLTTKQDDQIKRSWNNAEFTHWSDALSQARHLALENVRRQTKAAGGIGVTGVRIERRLSEVGLARPAGSWDQIYSFKHHNLLVSVIGTAIRPRPGAPKAVPATTNVLSLRDGRLKPLVIKQGKDFQVESGNEDSHHLHE